jgi:electron transport complex protein RnfB
MNKQDVYSEIAGKVGMPDSRWIPMILKKLITTDDVQILLEMPLSVSEFSEKYQLEEPQAEKKLEELADKGVCLPLEKNGQLKYCCVSNVIQVHDATIHGALNNNYSPVPIEIVEMWRSFRETEWLEMLKLMERMPNANHGRCIPSYSSVKDEPELSPLENLKTIIEKAPRLAVVDCPCRWLEVQAGEMDKPTFTCLSMTEKSVKYILDRKIGKELSLEEGYALLEECETAGLIPTAGKKGQPKQLCFCTARECIILRAQYLYGYDLWDRSRFDATVDEDSCEGCGTCVDRCEMDAISMNDDLAVIDTDKCFGCGICTITCPSDALKMKLVRPVEHLTESVISK